MWPRIRLLASVLLVPVFLQSCLGAHPGDGVFLGILETRDINASVDLSLLSVEADATSGVFLTLELANESETGVVFPPGYGLRGFLWLEDSNAWAEIPNEIVFPDVSYGLGPWGGAAPYIGTANYATLDKRILDAHSIRILVEGQLLNVNGEPAGAVAAYTDVDLR